MNEPDQNPRRYKWPWIVAAAVLLGIVLTILSVAFAAKKVERERDFSAPLPNSAPTR
ncbi:MAG TPA: hypothetical protein VIK53_12960 [Verrucomicrobiae bacterium]